MCLIRSALVFDILVLLLLLLLTATVCRCRSRQVKVVYSARDFYNAHALPHMPHVVCYATRADDLDTVESRSIGWGGAVVNRMRRRKIYRMILLLEMVCSRSIGCHKIEPNDSAKNKALLVYT